MPASVSASVPSPPEVLNASYGRRRARSSRALERRLLDARAVDDRLARVDVLVDQAVHRPGEVVLQRVGRKLRQRAHAHVQPLERVEAARQRLAGDADEAGRQPALRHEGGARALGERADGVRRVEVLGQVEVVGAAGGGAATVAP